MLLGQEETLRYRSTIALNHIRSIHNLMSIKNLLVIIQVQLWKLKKENYLVQRLKMKNLVEYCK